MNKRSRIARLPLVTRPPAALPVAVPSPARPSPTARSLAALSLAALSLLFAGASIAASAAEANAARPNGFDLGAASVPVDEIRHGGPPRDGIPAIDRPKFVPAREARLAPDDRVLGIRRGALARAYPVRLLNWHEIVNDRFGDEPVVVTYCPLCGSGMAFSARAAGRTLDFGVSGLLYNSDMLMYDRATDSLWSQLMAQAVSGPLRGTRLAPLPIEHTTWRDWLARNPGTQVLSFDTGFTRDYARDPYANYEKVWELMFPVARQDMRYDTKEWVLGLRVGGEAKAYPFSELARTAGTLQDTVGGTRLTVRFDAANRSARALDARGQEIAGVTAFWFAWYAFNPDTQVFKAQGAR